MNNNKLILKNIISLILSWILLATAIGMIIAYPSPHGMGIFVYCSFVLGVIGGVGHSIVYFLLLEIQKKSFLPKVGFYLGSIFGILSYPTSTMLSSNTIHFPLHIYDLILFLFLILLGAILGWFITKKILQPKNS